MPHAHSCEFHHGQSSSNFFVRTFRFELSVKQTKCHGLTVVLRSSFVPKASCQRHDTLQAPPQSTQRWVVDLKHLRGSTLVQWTGNSNRQAFKLRHTISLLEFDWQVRPRRTGEFLILLCWSEGQKNCQLYQSTTSIWPKCHPLVTVKKNSMRNMVAWCHHNMPKSWVSQTIRREFP